jgi:site-specific DNA-methyltransferase (adenine-specific)
VPRRVSVSRCLGPFDAGAGGCALTRWISPDGVIDLRLGRWQDVLADVEKCDAVICDPPYSARTHEGERGLRLGGSDTHRPGGAACARNAIGYSGLTEAMASEFASFWSRRASHWVVAFGDDVTCAWHRTAWASVGWLTFAPVLWVKENAPPRFSGDGPTSSCEHITVTRPRRKIAEGRSGSRPGHYVALTMVGRGGGASGIVGTKDPGAMRSIVRDYSKPGDLVVDPFCGGGTTALACAIEGRRCITSEMDPVTFEKARVRLAQGYTRDMFAG